MNIPPPPGYEGDPNYTAYAMTSSVIPDYSYRVLPFTLVVDTSGSMQGQPIAAINDELPRIHTAVASEPMLADVAHISVVSFNTSAQTVLPLSDLSEIARMPVLHADGATDYNVIFTYLKSKLQSDQAAPQPGAEELSTHGLLPLRRSAESDGLGDRARMLTDRSSPLDRTSSPSASARRTRM